MTFATRCIAGATSDGPPPGGESGHAKAPVACHAYAAWRVAKARYKARHAVWKRPAGYAERRKRAAALGRVSYDRRRYPTAGTQRAALWLNRVRFFCSPSGGAVLRRYREEDPCGEGREGQGRRGVGPPGEGPVEGGPDRSGGQTAVERVGEERESWG